MRLDENMLIDFVNSTNDVYQQGPLSKKVTQKGYFKWNKDLEHVLAKEVFRAHACKNTKDSSMKVKWQIVLTRLKVGDQSIWTSQRLHYRIILRE